MISQRGRLLLVLHLVCACSAGLSGCHAPLPPATSADPTRLPSTSTPPWHALFRTRQDWCEEPFGGEGPFEWLGDESMSLGVGETLTIVRYCGDVDTILPPNWENYEIELEAQRVSGSDFFCGLTFPVGKVGCVTLILGGWGGSLVGLSCLDAFDASENPTASMQRFECGRWYRVSVVVTSDRVTCRIDQDIVVDFDRSDHATYTVRAEVERSQPIGLSTYQTKGRFRHLRVRALPESKRRS